VDVKSAIDLVRHRAGEHVLDRLLTSTSADEVLVVSGSLIEGLGNGRSDFDFFVLSDDRPLDVPVRMAFAGASWLDIEYVRPRVLKELAGKFDRADPKNVADVLGLSRAELDRYYRLTIAVPVKGAYELEDIFSLRIFGSVLKPWAIVQAGAFAARATIALANDEPTGATLYASYAAHLCVTGTLTDAGEFYPSLKYALEKAVRAYGPGAPEVAAIAELLQPTGDCRDYVRRVCAYVDEALDGCLSTLSDDGAAVEPAPQLACHAGLAVPTVVTRKAAYDLLPEDVATAGALLSIPELLEWRRSAWPDVGALQARAHRLVLQETLLRQRMLVPVGGPDEQ
jgi:hypothetical protein